MSKPKITSVSTTSPKINDTLVINGVNFSTIDSVKLTYIFSLKLFVKNGTTKMEYVYESIKHEIIVTSFTKTSNSITFVMPNLGSINFIDSINELYKKREVIWSSSDPCSLDHKAEPKLTIRVSVKSSQFPNDIFSFDDLTTTLSYPTPVITSVTPMSGYINDEITVNGQNLHRLGSATILNSLYAIGAFIPTEINSTGTIAKFRIRSGLNGKIKFFDLFTKQVVYTTTNNFVFSSPLFLNVTPLSGIEGNIVTITGKNIISPSNEGTNSNIFTFNNVEAKISNVFLDQTNGVTYVNVIVPNSTTGLIRLNNAYGNTQSSSVFTYDMVGPFTATRVNSLQSGIMLQNVQYSSNGTTWLAFNTTAEIPHNQLHYFRGTFVNTSQQARSCMISTPTGQQSLTANPGQSVTVQTTHSPVSNFNVTYSAL